MLEVKDTDTECQVRRGTINPFAPPRDKHKFYNTKGKWHVLERLKSLEIVKVVIWNIHFEETHLNGFMQISAQQPAAWLHDSLVFVHRISRWLIVVELTYFI